MRLFLFFSIFFLWDSFVFAEEVRIFGEQHTLSSSPSEFSGSYEISNSYDIAPYIDQLKVKVVAPYTVEFALHINKLKVGTFIGISLYDDTDKEHAPIKDLSHTGNDKEVLESSFIQMKTFMGDNQQLAISPVVFKKGFRKTVNGKDIFSDPFESQNAISDDMENVIGADSSFFTRMMVSVAGKGAYHTEDTHHMIYPNPQGIYRFVLHMNHNLTNKWFFIVAITKVSIIPSDRGLRSPIITTPLQIKKI